MNKFILIDQSIIDSGGHYLEYALRVLKAAKKQGYQTVLATNNKFKDHIKLEYIDVIHPAFTYTFWQNFQWEYPQINRKKSRILREIKGLFDRLLYGVMISKFGYVYFLTSHGLSLFSIFRQNGGLTSDISLNPMTIVTGYTFAKALNLVRKIQQWIFGFSLTRYLQNRLKIIFLITLGGAGALLFSPILLPILVLSWRSLLYPQNVASMKFANDLQKLLVKIEAKDGDLIFIPTLGNVELVGVGFLFDRFPSRDLSWHFLYRRNLFEGHEPDYQNQIEVNSKTLEAFSFFKKKSNLSKVSFYTDTAGLTEQYNRLGIFGFSTLPIPVDETLSCFEKKQKKELQLSYFGDARDEKGFPHLPRMIADLRAANVAEGSVKYVLQSNFNIPGGEPGSRIALAELLAEPGRLVNLVPGPFESDEYMSLLKGTDILLIPYEQTNYYVRSSGVFAEALMAGIPVVVRNKTWMAQELNKLNQIYYQNLIAKHKVLQSIKLVKKEGNFSLVNHRVSRVSSIINAECENNNPLNETLVIRPKSKRGYVWIVVKVKLPKEEPGAYMDISWRSYPEYIHRSDKRLNFLRHYILDLRAKGGFVLLCLPNRPKLEIYFEHDYQQKSFQPNIKINIDKAEITAYEMALPSETPLFQVGALFCGEDDFSTAVLEVINRMDQYFAHGIVNRKKWSNFYNAANLINLSCYFTEN